MFKRKRIYILLGFLIVVAILSGGYFIYANSFCTRIKCLQIKDKNNYFVKDIYEDSKYAFRGLYRNGDVLLKVESIPDYSVSDAKQAVRVELDTIQGAFADAAAPYPGEFSDVITCDPKYKPVYASKKQNGIELSYFTGYVNNRLVFGSCVQDQAVYHDTLAMFYCPKQKTFYQLEIITPNKNNTLGLNENLSIVNSLGCNP